MMKRFRCTMPVVLFAALIAANGLTDAEADSTKPHTGSGPGAAAAEDPESAAPRRPIPPATQKAAPELSGREVAERVKNRPSYRRSESTALQMVLTNSRGKTRRREFLRYQMKTPGGKRTLMKFLLPRDIKNTGTLNQEVRGEDDIQHLYLPAAKKLRRISTSNKSQSWVGSDFTFEDLQELDLDRHRFKLLGTEKIGGRLCYKYEMTPLSEDSSIYGRQIRWTRVDSFLPVQWHYFDKQGSLLKTIIASDFRPVNGIQYAWRILVKNVQDDHSTLLTRRWIKLDTGMDPGLLSTRQLERSIDLYSHPEGLDELWGAALEE